MTESKVMTESKKPPEPPVQQHEEQKPKNRKGAGRRIIEIFTWMCAISTMAMENTSSNWTSAPSISLETGFDLMKPHDRDRAWCALEQFGPDAIVMAFPCSPWSRGRVT